MDLFDSNAQIERSVKMARLAGLLHDVGHSPFSHASEDLYPLNEKGGRFKHEDYTEALILSPPISELIWEGYRDYSITPEDVVNVFRDPTAHGKIGILLKDALAGELDADRMDYLARDSMLAGVTYGHYDVERLQDTITAVEDDEGVLRLVVEHGGLHALEGFLLARYSMFQQVYLAPVRRFYDIALVNFLREVLPSATYPPPDQLDEYLGWDDIRVLELARQKSSASEWAEALWNRHHWPVVSEIDGTDGEGIYSWAVAATEVQREFPESVLVDEARARTRLAGTRPYVVAGFEPEERPQILVQDRGGKLRRAEDVSALVRTISSQNVLIRRLYARMDTFERVREEFNRRN